MIAVDANVFIYVLEGNEELGESARQILDRLVNGLETGAASELVFLEVLSGASNQGQAQKLLEGVGFTYQPITMKVLMSAVQLRRKYGLHTPYAIHVASAIENGCTHFVTNDRHILRKKLPGIHILSLKAAAKLFA